MSAAGPTRTLVLLRHAKAEHHGYHADEQRTLTTTGRRQAIEVGSSLAAADLAPDFVLCSVAVRTRQTFELLSGSLPARPVVEYSEDLYAAGVSGTLEVIAGVATDVRTLLVVGHEPVMSTVASVLAGSGSEQGSVARVRVGVPVGAYSVLRLDVAWDRLERGSGRLEAVVAPAHHL